MSIKHTMAGLSLLLTSTICSSQDPAAQQAAFDDYKKQVMQEESLIRFYTFEDGDGLEVTNHVLLDPAQRAQTGGTLGSLSLQRHIHGDTSVAESDLPFIPPTWTEGRWPWKSAVTSGLDIAPYPWQVTKLFRSGITGTEFTQGLTLAAWVRIHENPGKPAACDIVTLGNGFQKGFLLRYRQAETPTSGRLQFKLGVVDDPRADLAAGGIVPGTWHHIAVTLDGEHATLYLDGAQADQKPCASAVIPTSYQDYPLVGPFLENSSPSRWGEFLMVGHNVYKDGQRVCQFDIDELGIYASGLSGAAIAALHDAGKPATSRDEQLADYRRVDAARSINAQITLSVPDDTSGYFRIDQPIPVTLDIPAATGLTGDFTAQISLETLYGKPIETLERRISVGTPQQVELLPPACGIYYVDITLRNPDGSVRKTLAEKHCIAVVPPAPDSLTEHNPVALWADHFTRWHFDAPIRRMNYVIGKPEVFIRNYDAYAARIPNFRAYLWYYYKPDASDESKAANRAMFEKTAELIKERDLFGIELSSEPHTKDVDAYIHMLKTATEILRPARPGIKFFPPGGSPSEIPLIAAILKGGGVDYVDGVSYHPYTMNPIGTYNWSSKTAQLKQVVAQYPDKNLSIWNTEGGVNSLPRIGDRPMTREDAHAARFPVSELYGLQFFRFFIGMVPEDESAALQCHAILMDLYQGYQIYTLCQRPHINGKPTMRGIAVTALAGQVLNHQVGVDRLPLASVEDMCLLIRQADGSTIAAVFGMTPATINLKVSPNTTYKTMDYLGNFGSITADADGLITLSSGKAPQYIFGVPADMSEVVPLALELPDELPDNGVFTGTLTVTNPFNTPFSGVLSVPEIPGAAISLDTQAIRLEPGQTATVTVTLKGQQLKRKNYLLSVNLRETAEPDSKLIASAQRVFYSPGVIQMVPQITAPITLNGRDDEWADIPATVCDDPDSLAHGKPNYAEMWVPQWSSRDDLSISVKTAWRKGDGIYFLLTVRDDVLVPAPEDKVGMAFRYDCLEFFFDSRPYGEQGTAIAPGADQAVVVPAIGDEPAACTLWHARKENNHVDITCVGRRTEDGYVIEGKIVPNDRSQFRVEAGSQFRMDFLVDDTDSLDPKLLRKSAMALHGTMQNAMNSDLWGRYELALDDE